MLVSPSLWFIPSNLIATSPCLVWTVTLDHSNTLLLLAYLLIAMNLGWIFNMQSILLDHYRFSLA